jgi:hypothetical protein
MQAYFAIELGRAVNMFGGRFHALIINAGERKRMTARSAAADSSGNDYIGREPRYNLSIISATPGSGRASAHSEHPQGRR